MPIVTKQSSLGGLSVREAMRMEVVQIPATASIQKAIGLLVKYKINALLVTEADEIPVGVVSKTDIISAYGASMRAEFSVENIMMTPPLFCSPVDPLESSLETMRAAGVYRLYALDGVPARVVGVLAYPDIVALLYTYCRDCENSLTHRRRALRQDDSVIRFRVKEAMSPSVTSFSEDATLLEVMDGLSVYRFGAVLITNRKNLPRGVISKTDLILAYGRGVSPRAPVRSILSSPLVVSCDEDAFVEDAIRRMIFSGVHRLFVYKERKDRIVGVFSLSNAARLRSGSCHACISSRIRVEGDG